MSLDDQLRAELLAAYEETKRLYWNPTEFRHMLEELGPIEAAARLAGDPRLSDGFVRLFEHRRLDLSVEAIILRGPWISRFEPHVLAEARRKLTGANYQFTEYQEQDSVSDDSLGLERERRLAIWKKLESTGEASGTSPKRVRELGLYNGARGTFADKERTRAVSEDRYGVAIGLLHTGQHYPDDLTDEYVIYHYPSTRSPGYDKSDIESIKNAKRLELPLFVISLPKPKSRERIVQIGWVEDWDDEQHVFLVSLGESAKSPQITEQDAVEFSLLADPKTKKMHAVASRPHQQKFSFEVFKRYGRECAVCSISQANLIDAAHLCGKQFGGVDDPRNGLPLCALHHRALDAFYFGIHPDSYELVPGNGVDDLASIHVSRSSLEHLRALPHHDALAWLWDAFQSAEREKA